MDRFEQAFRVLRESRWVDREAWVAFDGYLDGEIELDELERVLL